MLAFWAYKAMQQNKKPATEALALMPDSCVVYFATKNFSELSIKLNSQSLIVDKWRVFSSIKKLSQQIEFYDSLIYSNELVKEILQNNTIHFGIYSSTEKTNWLVAFNVKELKQEDNLNKWCITYFKSAPSGEYEISKGCYMTIDAGVVLLSDSKELIRKSFAKGNKLKQNTSFVKHLAGAGHDNVLQVYINHGLYRQHFKTPVLNVLLEAKETTAGLKINPDELIWNGDYTPDNTLLQKVIQSQNPAPMQFYDLLPFGTTWFKSIAINNSRRFQDTIQHAQSNPQLSYWQEIDEQAMYKVSNDFYVNINGVLVQFNSFQQQAAFVTLNDTLLADEVLKHIGKADSTFNNRTIYNLNQSQALTGMFGDLMEWQATHAFVFNNVLYFCGSIISAKELMYALSNNSTLKNNTAFMEYASQNLNNACNYIYYITPNSCTENVNDFMAYDFKNSKEAIENLTDANVTITNLNGRNKFRIQLKHQSPSAENTPNLLWQCTLDSNALQRPYLFTNHTTGQNEIVVQDKLNQLYLLNASGKVLWKKKINEIIRSEIHTVDIFKNGKLQLFFNTDNFLHLIDRNGKYVQGYPIKLPAPASNAVSLIDYDGDNNMRVFIACTNKLIYNFNLYGVKAEGYTPYKTQALVKLPIKFARVGQSDYLVTIDKEGTIHAFSRKGDARIGFKNKAIENCQDFSLITTNNITKTFLYYVDESNDLISKVSFSDKKDVLKLNTDLADSKIKFQNINNDQTLDFTAQTKSGLYAFDVNGTPIFFSENINVSEKASVEMIGTKALYYVFDKTNDVILIPEKSGNKVQRLKSVSPPAVFNLYKDNKRYMVYCYNGKLTCNLLK